MKKCLQKHVGARNELLGCTWLLDQGYEVFRNISQHGDVDVIAMRAGELLFLDVKQTPYNKQGLPSLNGNKLKASQIAAGVKRLNIYPDGHVAIVDQNTTIEEAFAKRLCLHCGGPFQPHRDSHTFCTTKCRAEAHNVKRFGLRENRRAYKKRKR